MPFSVYVVYNDNTFKYYASTKDSGFRKIDNIEEFEEFESSKNSEIVETRFETDKKIKEIYLVKYDRASFTGADDCNRTICMTKQKALESVEWYIDNCHNGVGDCYMCCDCTNKIECCENKNEDKDKNDIEKKIEKIIDKCSKKSLTKINKGKRVSFGDDSLEMIKIPVLKNQIRFDDKLENIID